MVARYSTLAFLMGPLCLGSLCLPLVACDGSAPSAQIAQKSQPATPKTEPKPEPKSEPKPEPKTEPQTQPKPQTKPEVKPDAKPAEPDPWTTPANPPLPTTDVKLGGRTFKLEMALTDEQRFHGLSGRTTIADDGGMIFVFDTPGRRDFVMRDCPIDIDIIYVNTNGRITALHHMKPEAPRGEKEKELSPPFANAPKWTWSNSTYENRLKKWPSRYDSVIVIEVKAGTLNINGSNPSGVTLKENDKLDIDIKALQAKLKE
jgi:uncharacterized membrane protein (UPF0127 family)